MWSASTACMHCSRNEIIFSEMKQADRIINRTAGKISQGF